MYEKKARMNQELYITRKRKWYDANPNADISIDEWSAFVKMDPEMRLDNSSTVMLENGESYTYNNPGTAVWLNAVGKQPALTFDFISGNIVIKNPSAAAIAKIKHAAFKLGASVQSSDGDILFTESLPHNDYSLTDHATIEKAGFAKRIWWRLQNSLFTASGK